MKFLLTLLMTFSLVMALDEAKQLKNIYPLQTDDDTRQLLCQMQDSIKTYLRATPLSSYDYFNQHRQALESQALITWIHGDIFLDKLTAKKNTTVRAALRNEHNAHLGDYRYDIFTLLSDLLLQMQEDADFSGSKEKAILNTLIDGYFDKLKDPGLHCGCIEEAVANVKQSDVLIPYTKIHQSKRQFHLEAMNLRRPKTVQYQQVLKQLNHHFKQQSILPIKDVAVDTYGNYLVLCEGKTENLQDDVIYSLSAKTLPLSYHFDTLLRQTYLQESLKNQNEIIARFNKDKLITEITLSGKHFLLSQLNPQLALKPHSEKTEAYKNYAAALGYMLASFHANPEVRLCQDFSTKATRQVNRHLLKVELIGMVYNYNETLERRWANFSSKKLLSCK